MSGICFTSERVCTLVSAEYMMATPASSMTSGASANLSYTVHFALAITITTAVILTTAHSLIHSLTTLSLHIDSPSRPTSTPPFTLRGPGRNIFSWTAD